MGLWAKSLLIFNSMREHGPQSIRRLAERTGLSHIPSDLVVDSYPHMLRAAQPLISR